MPPRMIYAVVLMLAVQVVASPLSFITDGRDETEVLAKLDAFVQSGRVFSQADGATAIDFTMSRGWWSVSQILLDASVASGIDLATTVHQTATKIKSQLQQLQDSLHRKKAAAGASTSGIAPAFEWAQSPDSLFLNVKFSHKLDTPATLGCETELVSFLGRSVTYRANCKDKKKAFHLSLHLLRDILPDNSTVAMASVGRAMITLRKADNSTGVWPRLTAQSKKLPNSHVWWAMADKFASENDAFEKERRRQKEAAEEAAAAAAAAQEEGGASSEDGPVAGGPAVTVGPDGEVEAVTDSAGAGNAPAATTPTPIDTDAAAATDGSQAEGQAAEASSSSSVGSILSKAAEAVNNLFTLPGAAAAPVHARRGGDGDDWAEDVEVFDEDEEGRAIGGGSSANSAPAAAAAVSADGSVSMDSAPTGKASPAPAPSAEPSKAPTTAGAKPAAKVDATGKAKRSEEQVKPTAKAGGKGKTTQAPTKKATGSESKQTDKKGAAAKGKGKDKDKGSKKASKRAKSDDEDEEDNDSLGAKEPPMTISGEMMFQQLAHTIENRRQQELSQIPRSAKEARAEVHAKYEKEFEDLRRKLGLKK